MKKKIIICSMIVCLVSILSACGDKTTLKVNVDGDVQSNPTGFIEICDSPIELKYDSMTGIVYINNPNAYGNTYTPYYASNGLPYRYNPKSNSFEEIKAGE